MVFYLDLILLFNFVIDYFILLLTSRYLNLTYKRWRLGLGAGVGALYTMVFFIPFLDFLHVFISKIVLSMVIIWISFGFIHLVRFFQTLATFYFISFLSGGGVLAIQYLFNIDHEVVNGIFVSRSLNPLLVIIFIMVAFLGIWLFSNRTYISLRRNSMVHHKIVEIEIYINNQSYKCKGLVDTGNRLYDPIFRKPVMILEVNEIPLIPSVLKEAYQKGEFQLELFNNVTEKLDSIWLSRINLVPYRGVSREMQFIITIRPDKVVIITNEEVEIVQTKLLIGLDYGQLSNDHEYQAIIHPDLLAG